MAHEFIAKNGLLTDTIDEKTSDTGVTIETVNIKDGNVDGYDVSVLGTKSHTQNTDTGTTSSTFQLNGTSGVRLYSYDSVNLQLRNPTDTNWANINPSSVYAYGQYMQFASSVGSPTINQATTASATGQILKIQAQQAATTGGKLQLYSGVGGTSSGEIELYRGSTLCFNTESGAIRLPQTNLYLGTVGSSSDKFIFAESAVYDGILKWNDTIKQWQIQNNPTDGYLNIGREMPYGGFVGFEDRSATNLSWNASTKQLSLTLAGSNTQFVFWEKNAIRYVKTSTQTATISSPAAGYWYFYFLNGTLTTSQSLPDAFQSCTVAYVLLDASYNTVLVYDQRHTTAMAWKTHEWAEYNIGMLWSSGLVPATIGTGSGSAENDGYVYLTDGVVYDEDIQVSIVRKASPSSLFEQELGTASLPGKFPILYRNSTGSDNWVRIAATNNPCYQIGAGQRIAYNTVSGSTWSLTQANQDAYYIPMFICATSSTGGSDGYSPVVSIMGQFGSSTLTDVQDFAWADMQLGNLNKYEIKPICKVIYKTSSAYANTIKAYVYEIQDLRTNTQTYSSLSFSPTDHSALSGLTTAGAHPAAAVSVDTTGYALNMSGKTDVQQAMTVIENGPSYLNNATVQWTTGTSAPTLKQADKTSTGTAAQLTISSQTNSNGTSGTGGKLVLTSGYGLTANGDIEIWRGTEALGSKYISLTSTATNIWNKPLQLNSPSISSTLGTDLVTNGNFESTGTWTYGTGWARTYVTDGYYAVGTAGSQSSLSQTITFEASSSYLVTFDLVTTASGTIYVYCGGGNAAGPVGTLLPSAISLTSIPVSIVVGTSGSPNSTFTIQKSSTWAGRIDNVTCKKITPIPSVLSGRDVNNLISLETRLGKGWQSGEAANGLIAIGRDSGKCYNSIAESQYNMFIGEMSGACIIDANNNLGIGAYSLATLTTGGKNTAIGSSALDSLVTGGANTAVGYNALGAAVESNWNTAVGSSALQLAVATYNVGIGYNACYSQTSGVASTAVGTLALQANTTGSYNTALGYRALYSSQTGAGSVAVGHQALYYAVATGTPGNTGVGYGALYGVGGGVSTYTNNTALGYLALNAATTGSYNACIGSNSAKLIADGAYNTALGYQSLQANISGSDNVALGANALYSQTGSGAIAIGRDAAYTQASGGTVAVGYQAAKYMSVNSIAIGYQALLGVNGQSSGTNNVAIGYTALTALTTGASNVCVGKDAGIAITSGSYNTVVGSLACHSNQTGSNNVLLGANAGYSQTTISNSCFIGVNAGYGASGTDTTAIGYYSGYISSGGYCIYIGTSAGRYTNTGSRNVGIGYQSLGGSALIGSISSIVNAGGGKVRITSTNTGTFVGGESVSITGTTNYNGTFVISNPTASTFDITTTYVSDEVAGSWTKVNTGSYNTAVGYNALIIHGPGTYNTAYGYQSGYSTSTGGYNTYIGTNSGYSTVSGSYNTYIGNNAGYSTTSGGYNVSLGHRSLYSNISGSSNVALGTNSLYSQTGTGAVAIGVEAAYTQTSGTTVAIGYQTFKYGTGTGNTAIGYNAMLGVDAQTTGTNNIAVGTYSLDAITTGGSNSALGVDALGALTTGSTNVAIGYQAGDSITTGSSNTIIGYSADGYATYNYQIALGYNAVANVANTMVIGSSTSGEVVHTITRGSDNGRCIELRLITSATSTDGYEMFLNAAAGTSRYVLTNNTVASFHGTISSINTTTGNVGAWEITGCIKKVGASNVALAGTPTITALVNEGSVTTPAISADTSNQSLKILVYGTTGNTVKYSANIHISEVKF